MSNEIIYTCNSINNKNIRENELKILRKKEEELCFEFGESETNIKKRFYRNLNELNKDFKEVEEIKEKIDSKENKENEESKKNFEEITITSGYAKKIGPIEEVKNETEKKSKTKGYYTKGLF